MTSELDRLYPELGANGRLAPVVLEALLRIGSHLQVTDPLGRFTAVVRLNDRMSQVMVVAGQRAFSVDFWSAGVCYGQLWCEGLSVVATAIREFLELRCTTRDLERRWPDVAINEEGRAHEEGRLVDYAWSRYLDPESEVAINESMREVLAAASRRERFRRLMPFISMRRVCFSSRTGWPYTSDCPSILVVTSGDCRVFAPGVGDDAAPVFGGGVEEAVAAAELALPATVHAARDGTANDDGA